MQGRILKGVGSFYTVQGENGAVVCKARGRFRKEGLVPVPGDWVDYDVGADENGYLLQIHPRRNLLTRPAVSNIDRLFIVLSASQPEMDLLLCDKLLLQCASRSIQPILVCNKCDDGPEESYIELAAQYKPAGYAVLPVSAKTGYGIPEIIKRMEGCVCCFAGQSAVGKSSLLNCILPDLTLEVGDLSRKLLAAVIPPDTRSFFPLLVGQWWIRRASACLIWLPWNLRSLQGFIRKWLLLSRIAGFPAVCTLRNQIAL